MLPFPTSGGRARLYSVVELDSTTVILDTATNTAAIQLQIQLVRGTAAIQHCMIQLVRGIAAIQHCMIQLHSNTVVYGIVRYLVYLHRVYMYGLLEG